MDLQTATSRLRRTFAYPSDTTTTSPSSSRHLSPDDDEDDGPALDEQEQEDLIHALAQQNAARNAQFRLLLLALPALSAVPYLFLLYGGLSGLISSRRRRGGGSDPGGGGGGGGGGAADIWIALLALSSLASTAWALWSLPPGVTGIRALDAWTGSLGVSDSGDTPAVATASGSSSRSQGHGLLTMGANARRRRRASTGSQFFWAQQHNRSPLEKHLPVLNLAICGLLVLAGLLSPRRSAAAAQQYWGHVGLANLPALIYVVVLVAKMLMGSIDPERELSSLRYEYKGA
ncbi:hypothetical protein F5Y14DRAFT_249711 [Nemania sp. NC0429]|nr:hypothetical protein F5Y14DRAFT_249711 [Nemania sp. NC0429]